MVLDTYDQSRDLLIFKNTTGPEKRFEIKRTDPNASDELFFVHITIRDMASLPLQEERAKNKEAEIQLKKKMYKKF